MESLVREILSDFFLRSALQLGPKHTIVNNEEFSKSEGLEKGNNIASQNPTFACQ